MAKHQTTKTEALTVEVMLPDGQPLLDIREDTESAATQPMGVEPSYTDTKGAAWRRLMAQRYPKAYKALERLITLGVWNNYHYTQREAKVVCQKLRALITRIEEAHQGNATAPKSPPSLPWEE